MNELLSRNNFIWLLTTSAFGDTRFFPTQSIYKNDGFFYIYNKLNLTKSLINLKPTL